MKAMILAAGRGERLRPMTDYIPKPLVSIGSTTLIDHVIVQLARAGVRDIVINVCYLAQKIMDYVGDGAQYGVKIQYSWERDGLLGTGGGIQRALPLLGDQPFWVVSADVWSEYHFALSAADVAWDSTDAYLLMVPNPTFHPEGDYGMSLAGKLVPEPPRYTYANVGLMHAGFFADMQTDIFELSRVINRAMLHKRICAELYAGPWFNVGDLEQLQRLRDYVALSS